MATVHPMFATPLYHANIGGLNQIKKDLVRKCSYDQNAVGHADTDDKYLLDRPELANLKSKILDEVDNFTHEILGISKDVEFYMLNSWSNRHKPREYNTQHWHSNCVISGVYYMTVAKDSGDIVFNQTHNHVSLFGEMIRLDIDKDAEMNEYNCEEYSFCPEEGDLFLFPWHVMHRVNQNLSEIDRYSIAFNIWMRGKIGDGTCQLSLS